MVFYSDLCAMFDEVALFGLKALSKITSLNRNFTGFQMAYWKVPDSLKVMAMSFQSGHFPKLVCVCREQYLISVNDVI